MHRTLLTLIAILTLALFAGCESGKHKQAAYDAWNQARGGAQASLAAERYKLGNLDDARKAINEAITLEPKNPSHRLLSARIYIEKNMLEQAEQELAVVKTVDPKSAEADYLSGIIYQRWSKPDLALQSYTSAFEKAPNELPYIMARAEMLVQMGKTDEALVLLESKLTYFEASGPLRDEIGGVYMQVGRTKEAIEMFHQATILSPEDLTMREHLATAYFRDAQYRKSLEVLDTLLRSSGYDKRTDLYLLKGECHLQLNDLREARAALETVVEQNPSLVAGLVSLAKVAIRSNDLERADLCLRKALALKPEDPQIHLGIGYLRMRQNRLDDASAAFRKSSELNPKDAVSVCMMGLVLEKQGKTEEAMQLYGKALQLDPKDPLAKSLMSKAK